MQQNKPQLSLDQLRIYQNDLYALVSRELREEADLRDKRQLLFTFSRFQDVAFNLALRYSNRDIHKFATTVLLRWHQVDTEELLFMQRLIQHSNSSEIKKLATKLNAQRRNFSRLINQKNINLAELKTQQQQLQSLEQSLARHSQMFKQQLAIQSINTEDIQASMTDGTGLLALRIFSPFNTQTGKWKKIHWLAVLLNTNPNGLIDFQFHDLGSVEASTKLFLKARNSQAKADYQTLYQYFFGAFDKKISKINKLYIAPDGFLHLTDFNRWRLSDGNYWIQRQAIHRLNTARDIVRKSKVTNKTRLITVGGVTYDKKQTDLQLAANEEFTQADLNLSEQIKQFSQLPATIEETNNLSNYSAHCVDITPPGRFQAA